MSLLLDLITKTYFCTGARNHELLAPLAIKSIIFECDERMASFKALGATKSKQNPVAICTTSGTAVAECLPAMLEAYYSKSPLILITGDRPKKLRGSGSPQTIDHETLTRSCRGAYFEVSIEEFLVLQISKPQYPIHINVLIDDTSPHDKVVHKEQGLNEFSSFIKNKKSPLFLFSHEEVTMLPFIEAFYKTGIPFYAEAMSGGRHLSSLGSEKDLVKNFSNGVYDSIVRVGFTPLSKLWRLLEKKTVPVFSFDSRSLPALSYGQLSSISSEELKTSGEFWQILSHSKFSMHPPSKDSGEFVNKFPHSEISLIKGIHDLFNEDNIVYLGNSLIIRFFELIQTKRLRIHGNRGVNGIDGQLATAIGLASETMDTVFCILGDMTTQYDLSSLRDLPPNLKLIIINNGGGRIFDMLSLDQRIIMSHENNFRGVCQAFNLVYSNELQELKDVQVLELFPSQDETRQFLKEWNA